MEDKVLITFQSKNASKVHADLKGIQRLANAASVAVRGMNTSLAGTKAASGTRALSNSMQTLNTQQQRVNKSVAAGTKKVNHYHKAQGALRGQNEGMARSFSSMRNALLLYAFATVAVSRALKDVVKTHMEWEATMMKTTQMLKVTAGASGHTAEQLRDMAVAMGDLTLESTQGVMNASNALLTFKNVTGDTFDRALSSAADLAALGFGSIESAAVQLGKALEDPKIGLASLKRVGVTFSKDQQKSIKLLVKQNQLYVAQRVILKALESQSKGAAKAAAKGLAGAFDSASEAMAELKRELGGGGLGDALAGMAKGLAGIVGWLNELDQKVPVVTGVLMNSFLMISAALLGVAVTIGVQLHKAIVASIYKVQVLTSAMIRLSTVSGASWGVLLTGFTLVGIAAATVTASVSRHIKEEKSRRESMEASAQAVEDLRDSIKELYRDIENAPTALGKQITASSGLTEMKNQLDASKNELIEAQKALVVHQKSISEANAKATEQMLRASQGNAYGQQGGGSVMAIWDAIAAWRKHSSDTGEVEVVVNNIADLEQTADDATASITRLNAELAKVRVSAKAESLVLGIQKDNTEREGLLESIEILKQVKALKQAVASGADETGGASKAFNMLESLGVDEDTIFRLEETNVSVLQLTKLIEKLRKQANVTTPEMEKLLSAASTFGIELPDDIADRGNAAMDGDMMKERQKVTLEHQKELLLLQQQGLLTQSEATILQAELNEEMLKSQESANAGTEIIRGMQLGVSQIMQETQSFGEIVATTVGDMFNSVGAAMSQMIQTGKVEWKQLAASIFSDLATMLMQKAIMMAVGSISGMFGGAPTGGTGAPGVGAGANTGGSFFSGSFAGGGTYPGGAPMLVGERGPELLLPSSAGRIVNNTQMNGRGMGDGSSAPQEIRIVNAVDGDAILQSASSSTIDRIVMNSINNNSSALRGVLA